MAALLRRSGSVVFRRLLQRPLSTTRVVLSYPSAVPIDHEVIYTDEHKRLRESLRKLIDAEINPHVEEWEKKGHFPAHKVTLQLKRTE